MCSDPPRIRGCRLPDDGDDLFIIDASDPDRACVLADAANARSQVIVFDCHDLADLHELMLLADSIAWGRQCQAVFMFVGSGSPHYGLSLDIDWRPMSQYVAEQREIELDLQDIEKGWWPGHGPITDA